VFAFSDLVLSLSTKPESFGRTVLEALSLGRPVLGYDHGGVGEVLAQVYPAGLVPLGDQQALVNKACELLDATVPVPPQHPFSRAKMLEGTLALYEQLASE
jgi:glycosyltransferase involved in cell wall biosynthesis